jgi:hypothetical protein
MKCKITLFLLLFALLPFATAFPVLNPSSLYVDLNETYTFSLASDNETLDINLYTNGSSFDINWSGSQYEVSLIFDTAGNYPFVVNSTDISGQTTGTFIVREPYYAIFELYTEEPPSWCIWCSDFYTNDYGYVTAEFSDRPTNSPFNHYDPTLEKYVYPISSDQFHKPVFYGEVGNCEGGTCVKLWEEGNYAFRLIDGVIVFPSDYSYPNVTKSYGTNAYLGKYPMNSSGRIFELLLEDSDLHPYRSLANWIYIILLIVALIGSIFIFFIAPDYPSIALTFGLGGSAILTILRIALWVGGY